ncbi:MAG TPA: relaxase/mobilization nuclease domain-containing protein [Xanthobacteraceae bacterium]|nr:relaxase/mobilization nuclease domain-containing protein [Xanthobacteraceae bacterium]
MRLTSQSALLKDWDLDLDDALRRRSALAPTNGRVPKLAHKLMFSMPPGTPPEKVLGAVRTFAREEFWGQHRYVFALHTDEAHPHVHLVVKALSEQGVRLNIRKATLRHWRSEFARNLRAVGVEANATERAVRGQHRKAKKDGIHRASLRGESTFIHTREGGATAQTGESPSTEQGKRTLISTRRVVEGGWHALAGLLERGGHLDLARDVRRFVAEMATPRTDRELVHEPHEYAKYGIRMRDKAYSR